MCGIVGYIGHRNSVDVLMEGLRKLEYRGYDSAGVALLGDGEILLRRSVGKLVNLEMSLRDDPLSSPVGVGHTRWATHGAPTEHNAHPHVVNGVAIVHNGIIENHTELREEFVAAGRDIKSETDTELVAHLIDIARSRGLGLLDAVREALSRVEGVYALLVVSTTEPDQIIAARKSSPLILGIGEGENFIASDVPALLRYTNRVIYLEDDDIALVRREGIQVWKLDGTPQQHTVKTIDMNPVAAEKEGHKHFMHKEIHEQPRAFIAAMEDRFQVPEGDVVFDGGGLEAINATEIQRIVLLACGTAGHAAQIGRYYIESIAGIPCEVDLASEYRYRDPIVEPGTLAIAVSQSGETADTLAALREVKRRGAQSIAVCNVPESTIARTADGVCYTHAGPEIGVASTKAFITQVAVLLLISIWLGRRNGNLSQKRAKELLEEMSHMPIRLQEVLASEPQVREIARWSRNMRGYLFIGRHANHWIAMEGALKLKEISYLHAEGYAAGEMKHGPIALIDEEMLIVAIAPASRVYEKMLSNLEEARARGGKLFAIVTRGRHSLHGRVDRLIEVPPCDELLTPILTVLPLQLLAYHIADLQGTDVDQPRNLAKSVTVE
ncbi:MAG: glutamine--fructose-6-phosphate transaminase (isomerizing) [Deltaproteobacteria bacterium]|nr:glutamine--fructose-6-phosphate transaminase (isomerizing) [Deltaproteobacteria bacterium]